MLLAVLLTCGHELCTAGMPAGMIQFVCHAVSLHNKSPGRNALFLRGCLLFSFSHIYTISDTRTANQLQSTAKNCIVRHVSPYFEKAVESSLTCPPCKNILICSAIQTSEGTVLFAVNSCDIFLPYHMRHHPFLSCILSENTLLKQHNRQQEPAQDPFRTGFSS